MTDNVFFNSKAVPIPARSKVLLKIIDMKKDDEGNLKISNERYETVKGKELVESCLQNSDSHSVEIVYS